MTICDLQKGIVDGRPLKDWWENSPYGAFSKTCKKLGINLFFSDEDEVPGFFEVEIDYSYRGRGTTTITVEAFNEKDAEKLALEKFDSSDLDTRDAEIDDCEVANITKKEPNEYRLMDDKK